LPGVPVDSPLKSPHISESSNIGIPRILSNPTNTPPLLNTSPLEAEKMCEYFDVLMDAHGYHDAHQCSWVSMGIYRFHGYPWISINICVYQLISMHVHAYACISMDIHGHPWISMDIQGHPWISGLPQEFGHPLNLVSPLDLGSNGVLGQTHADPLQMLSFFLKNQAKTGDWEILR
jgi:hypothetical protein